MREYFRFGIFLPVFLLSVVQTGCTYPAGDPQTGVGVGPNEGSSTGSIGSTQGNDAGHSGTKIGRVEEKSQNAKPAE